MIKSSKKNYLIFTLYTACYKFKFCLKTAKFKVKFFKSLNILQFTFLTYFYYRTLFFNNLNLVLRLFSVPFFRKLKFKGKGYYIYKNKRNTITPQFGYAHRIYIYSYFVAVKFLSKTKIFIFGFLKEDVITTSLDIRKRRFINIFTGRGVRFSRQIIYKKTGKVSSYR